MQKEDYAFLFSLESFPREPLAVTNLESLAAASFRRDEPQFGSDESHGGNNGPPMMRFVSVRIKLSRRARLKDKDLVPEETYIAIHDFKFG